MEVGQGIAMLPIPCPEEHERADAGYCLTSGLSRGMSRVCPESPEQCVTIQGSARVEYSVRGHGEGDKEVRRTVAPGRFHTRRPEDNYKMGKRTE